MLDSTFRSNQAVGGASGSTQTGGGSFGGGISVGFPTLGTPDTATLTLSDSTLTGNVAVGGTGGPPAVWAVPNSIDTNLPSGSGFALQPAGTGGPGIGGALNVSFGATVNVVGSTIESNFARGGASGGYLGSAGIGLGGGVSMDDLSSVTFDPDTIIANNHASASANNNTYTAFTSGPA